MRLTIALFFLLLFDNLAIAAPYQIDPTLNVVSLSSSIEYWEDTTNTKTIADVIELNNKLWEDNTQVVFNKGYSSSTFWLKIPIGNTGNPALERLLEISYPLLDYVTVYFVNTTDIQKVVFGDKYLFHDRPINHRHFITPLKWQENEPTTLFIEVKTSTSVQIPITLWDAQHFFDNERTQNLLHGIFFGIMFVMLMYNFFIYLAVKENNYLYYVLFVAFSTVFLSTLTGFSYQYFWPTLVGWNDRSIIVSLSGALIFAVLFSQSFLQIKKTQKGIIRLNYFFYSVCVALIILSFIISPSIIIRVLVPFAAICCIYGALLGIFLWYTQGGSAKYYTIAWGALLAGGIVLALSKYNVIPISYVSDYAIQAGCAFEIVLLSLALAERINQERKMRFDAQQEALIAERELRQSREHALDTQKQATELLEQRVQERTHDLELLNRKLEQISDTDQLTGLKNRRHLDRVMEEEFFRSCCYKHSMALIMLDIDHFKNFNDSYGHLIGDDCLKAVAAVIQKGLRWPSDHGARYGGEEFCMMLPETTINGAIAVAERVLQNVRKLEIKVKEKTVPITISIGVTSLIPTINDSPSEIINQADKALYLSKQNGRNQITIYDHALTTIIPIKKEG